MSREDIARWERRYQDRIHATWTPDPWIVAEASRLAPGLALDVACGVGQHARWLAAYRHRVIAVDGSYTAVRRGRNVARDEQLGESILFAQADLEQFGLPAATFDLIVVVRFLLRPLAPHLAAALRPGGHLLYATYTQARLERRPDFNPVYLLASGELPHLFRSLTVCTYEEHGEWARLHARRPTSP